jgi:hypothetical protein
MARDCSSRFQSVGPLVGLVRHVCWTSLGTGAIVNRSEVVKNLT